MTKITNNRLMVTSFYTQTKYNQIFVTVLLRRLKAVILKWPVPLADSVESAIF